MISFDISKYKAIVTGGTRGLGYGIAEGFLEAGAGVVIFGTTEKVFDVAESFCQRGYNCSGIAVDLSESKNRENAFDNAVSQLGGLDILVNCAGVQYRSQCEEFPLDEWNKVMDINLTVPFHLSQLAAKEFLRKVKPYGKIINIASMLSFFGGYNVPAYAASKGGIAQMTKAMCNELASKGINVNAVAPGYMDTDMNTALLDTESQRYKEITQRIPSGRWGNPEDVKGAAIFLASHGSDYLNGAIIPVDGGYLVR